MSKNATELDAKNLKDYIRENNLEETRRILEEKDFSNTTIAYFITAETIEMINLLIEFNVPLHEGENKALPHLHPHNPAVLEALFAYGVRVPATFPEYAISLEVAELLLNAGTPPPGLLPKGIEDPALAELLLEAGTEIIPADAHEVIMNATNAGMIDILLKFGADLPDAMPLNATSPEVVQIFLEAGIDPNAPSGMYGAPIRRMQDPDSVRLLLEYDAELPEGDILYNKSEPETVKILLEAGADPKIGCPLAGQNNPSIVEMLLKAGANPNTPSPTHGLPIETAQDPEVVRLLLEYDAELPEGDILSNKTNPATIKQLLDAGATPIICTTSDSTHDNPEIMELLLGAGANPNASYGMSDVPIKTMQDPEVVRLLLEYGATLPEEGILWTKTNPATIQLLLDTGADPKLAPHPLPGQDNLEVVKMLLEAGADPAAHRGMGSAFWYAQTPEHISLLLQYGNLDPQEAILWNKSDPTVVEILLEAGSDPTLGSPFRTQRNPEIIKMLVLAGADPMELDVNTVAPDIAEFVELVQAVTRINAENIDREYPKTREEYQLCKVATLGKVNKLLMEALEQNFNTNKLYVTLITFGADINTKTTQGTNIFDGIFDADDAEALGEIFDDMPEDQYTQILNKYNLLEVAITYNTTKCFDWLLESGVNLLRTFEVDLPEGEQPFPILALARVHGMLKPLLKWVDNQHPTYFFEIYHTDTKSGYIDIDKLVKCANRYNDFRTVLLEMIEVDYESTTSEGFGLEDADACDDDAIDISESKGHDREDDDVVWVGGASAAAPASTTALEEEIPVVGASDDSASALN